MQLLSTNLFIKKLSQNSFSNFFSNSRSFSLDFLEFVKTLVFHVFTAEKCLDKNKKNPLSIFWFKNEAILYLKNLLLIFHLRIFKKKNFSYCLGPQNINLKYIFYCILRNSVWNFQYVYKLSKITIYRQLENQIKFVWKFDQNWKISITSFKKMITET